jgi:flagellar motility protein MotE (MotC chaperone)
MNVARSTKNSTPSKKKKNKAAILTQSSKPAKPLFRLIPLTMFTAAGLLCLKSIEIYQSGRALSEELLVSTVIAQDAPEEPAAEPVTDTAESPAEEPEAAATSEAAPVAAPRPTDAFDSQQQSLNKREIAVLESLSERREKLDKLERELALKEKVLQATESRIDQKITELTTMSTELKELLVTYEKEEDAKISSLVKIYEAMKPKDAARIFNDLDMDILLMVVDRMSERRVAPVLAGMDPQKARDVTQQLADQQRNAPKAQELDDDGYSPPLF